MTRHSYTFFLAFIVCLIPLSMYSFPDATFNELTIYKDQLTILKNATGSAAATGISFLGAICIINLAIWVDNSKKTEEQKIDYIPLLSRVAAAIIVGGLSGFNDGYSKVLRQFD